MLRLMRSMKAVLICQPQAASTCWTASSVPNTTRCRTRTRRRWRTVLTPWAYRSWGSGIQRGLGKGPVVCRREGCTHCPKWLSSAVAYSLKPSVRNSATQSGANPWTTGCTRRWAMASVRSPTSRAHSTLLTGSMAAQTHWGERGQALDGLSLADLPRLNRTEEGKEFVELHL